MKRLLVVTASTGAGHNSAAASLCEALEYLGKDTADVDCVDLLDPDHSSWISRFWGLYAPVTVHCPRLWRAIYGFGNNRWFCCCFRGLVAGPCGHSMNRLFERYRPQVIISVHPLGVQMVAGGLRQTKWPARLITVVTDLAEPHAAWIAPEVSLYVVPTEEIRAGLLRRGVDPRLISVLGVPLGGRFSKNGVDPSRVRREMGLAEDTLTVLLTGGGEGAGDILSAAQAIASAKLPVQLILACGRNKRLLRRLGECALELPHVALGFQDDMSQLMKASDVVAGKAGAMTIGEAIVTEKPIIILSPLPGQERANAEFVVRHRFGVRVADICGLVEMLTVWISDHDEMAKLVAEAKSYRRLWTQAAAGIAAAILEEVSRLEKEGSVSCL